MDKVITRWVFGMLCFSGACAQLDNPNDFYNLPAGSQVEKLETSAFAQAWEEAGLPSPSHCPQVWQVSTSYKFFAEICRRPQCSDPSTPHDCAWACMHNIEDGVPTMFYVRDGREELGHTERDEQMHETFHSWSACTGLDQLGDPAHSNARIWVDAIAAGRQK